jgi:hypothetical protein
MYLHKLLSKIKAKYYNKYKSGMISIGWRFNQDFSFRKGMKNLAEYYEIVFTGCGKISDLVNRSVLPVSIPS